MMLEDMWSTAAVAIISVVVIILAVVFYLVAVVISGRSGIGLLGIEVKFTELNNNPYNIANIFSQIESDGQPASNHAVIALATGTVPGPLQAALGNFMQRYEKDIKIFFIASGRDEDMLSNGVKRCGDGAGYCTGYNFMNDGCGAGRKRPDAKDIELFDKECTGFLRCCLDDKDAAVTRCGPDNSGFCEAIVPAGVSSEMPVCPPERTRETEYINALDYDKKCYALNPSGEFTVGGAYCCMPLAAKTLQQESGFVEVPVFYRNNQLGLVTIEVEQ